MKRTLHEPEFWRIVLAEAKARASASSGANMAAGLDLLDDKLAATLTDEAIILIIEQLSQRKNEPGYQGARAKLLAEQHKRASAKHDAVIRISVATLIAAIASVILTAFTLL